MQWKPPIIENYQLKIPDSYTFITSNLLFEALGIINTIKLSAVKSSLFKGDLTYSPKHAVNSNHLIFLQLKKTCHRLEFALLDNQNNEIIPKSFYLQLCNKNDECIR